MLLAVPLGVHIGIGQPIVGAEVDDPLTGLQQLAYGGGGSAVRQTAEHALAAGRHLSWFQVLQTHIQASRQLWVHGRHVRTAFLAAGQHRNLRLRMAHQNLDQLDRRVPGGSQNPNANHVQVFLSAGEVSCSAWPVAAYVATTTTQPDPRLERSLLSTR